MPGFVELCDFCCEYEAIYHMMVYCNRNICFTSFCNCLIYVLLLSLSFFPYFPYSFGIIGVYSCVYFYFSLIRILCKCLYVCQVFYYYCVWVVLFKTYTIHSTFFVSFPIHIVVNKRHKLSNSLPLHTFNFLEITPISAFISHREREKKEPCTVWQSHFARKKSTRK